MHDQLQTIAQIAIGLAGFASVATVLRKQGHMESLVVLQRLLVLLVLSISVVFLSFLPAVLSGIGLEDAHVWRVSAVVFAGFAIFLLTPISPIIRNIRVLREAGYERYQMYKDWTFYPFLIAIAWSLTVSIGVFVDDSGAAFVFSLGTLLLGAAVQFVRLVITLVDNGAS